MKTCGAYMMPFNFSNLRLVVGEAADVEAVQYRVSPVGRSAPPLGLSAWLEGPTASNLSRAGPRETQSGARTARSLSVSVTQPAAESASAFI